MVSEGQTVQFDYARHKSGPKTRLVLVNESKSNHFKGFDYSVGEPKTFDTSAVAALTVVADVGEEIVKPETLVTNPAKTPVDLLVSLYKHQNPDVKTVRFDIAANVLVVRKAYKPNLSVTIDGDLIHVDFGNEDGNTVGITFRSQEVNKFTCNLSRESITDFIERLKELFQDYITGLMGKRFYP